MEGAQYRNIDIPLEIRDKVKRLLRSYRLRFSAIDFAINREGDWIFFEVNPNGQWAWLDMLNQNTTIYNSFLRAFSLDMKSLG